MTERRFVLALDQGTTGSRAMVVDAAGAVRGSGYVELTQHYPRPGWVEHDAEEIWTTTVRAIGDALANNFLCQFQADVLNVEVLRPVITETTAMGAAFLAGVGAGIWKVDALSSRWRLERRFAPSADAGARGAAYAGWQRAVERARGWAAP